MNALAPSTPAAGFNDPVQQSQQAFRHLLQALAHPGRIIPMPLEAGHPASLTLAMAAALLTLCDLDTPVWLGPGCDDAETATWLRFHTGAPLVAQAGDAVIAVAVQPPKLEQLGWGSDVAPERGATLLLAVEAFDGAADLVLTGPGIRERQPLSGCGLGDDFWRQRAAMRDAFPRGVDIYLVAADAILGLPRSTQVQLGAKGA
ncbi:phosphonate C-P lyase system protein PhnH [Ferrovibrio sp.]|uniref:phosphonate C-P lyase system protein PhnH n=1 Tax=Ferrovibrio sp. TaxID=1917215 RepID=UPI003D0F7B2D